MKYLFVAAWLRSGMLLGERPFAIHNIFKVPGAVLGIFNCCVRDFSWFSSPGQYLSLGHDASFRVLTSSLVTVH
jgi:hypothetical protein